MLKNEWLQQGFIDEPLPDGIDVKKEIRKMCEEKDAIILAHYYTQGEIQDIADFIGDSLALAQKAAKTDAKIIVMCGVHFMAETNKILCPEKNAVMCTIADVRLDPCGLQRIYDAFFEELYPWLGKEEMEELRLTMPAPVLASPAKCGIAPDTRYVFPEGNALGIHWLKMQENGLIYENGRGVCHLPFHPGETIRASYPGWAEVPATVSAGWAKKGLLRVRCYAIGDSPCGFDMLLSFREDTVTLLSRRSHDPLTNGYEGTASGKRG